MLNAIFNENKAEEGQISNRIKRGKNTTTVTRLYPLEENSYIADTPGFSTFSIYEIPKEQLAECFIEFRSHIKDCEFVGCTHIKEELCGIKYALKKDKIAKERYEHYVRIYEELKEKEEYQW